MRLQFLILVGLLLLSSSSSYSQEVGPELLAKKVPTPAEWIAPRLKLRDIELKVKLEILHPQQPKRTHLFELAEKRIDGELEYRSLAFYTPDAKLLALHLMTPSRVILYFPNGVRRSGFTAFYDGSPASIRDESGELQIYGPEYIDAESELRKKRIGESPPERLDIAKSLPPCDPRLFSRHNRAMPSFLAASLGLSLDPPGFAFNDFTSALGLLRGVVREVNAEGLLMIETPLDPRYSMKSEYLLDPAKDYFPLSIQRVRVPGTDERGVEVKSHISFLRGEPKEYRDSRGEVVWYPRKLQWGGVDADDKGKPIGQERISAILEIESAHFNRGIPFTKFEYSALPIEKFPVRIEPKSSDIHLADEFVGSPFALEARKIVGVIPDSPK